MTYDQWMSAVMNFKGGWAGLAFSAAVLAVMLGTIYAGSCFLEGRPRAFVAMGMVAGLAFYKLAGPAFYRMNRGA
jgi:hypothetical protein